MKKILLVLAVCLSLGACGQPEGKSSAQGKQEALVLINKGLEEFQKPGGIDQAIVSFQKAAELDPRSAAAYNMLGEAYRVKHFETKAQDLKEKEIAAFKKAIEVDSNYWPAWINLGYTYYGKGDMAQAIPLLKKGLALNPQHPSKVYLEKMIAAGEGKTQAQPPQAQPSKPPLMKQEAFTALVKGYDLFRERKYKAAEEQFQKALKADPHNPFALNNLAALSERQGKPKEAMGLLLPALYYAPLYNDKLEQVVFPGGLTAAAKPLREREEAPDNTIGQVVNQNRIELGSKIPRKTPAPPAPSSPPPEAPQK